MTFNNFQQALSPFGIFSIANIKKQFPDFDSRQLNECEIIDMRDMANDVSPFLFNYSDLNKVILSIDYIKQEKLEINRFPI